MASWQTCFAMPVRCDLLAQHPFTVSSSNGRQRSSLRQTREVGERTAWCASDPRCVRIISTHPATPCLTQHRADSRHRHRPSRRRCRARCSVHRMRPALAFLKVLDMETLSLFIRAGLARLGTRAIAISSSQHLHSREGFSMGSRPMAAELWPHHSDMYRGL